MSSAQDYKGFLRVLADIPRVAAEVDDLPALTAKLQAALGDATELDVPISRLGFPPRVENLLKRKCSIYTIRDLTRRSAAELRETKRFGNCALWNVQDKLAEQGLKLRDDPDPK